MFSEDIVSPISSPHQQVSAVLACRDFLKRLTKSRETPRVAPGVRREALALLRHFPPTDRLRPILERSLCGDPKEPHPLTSKFGLY